MALPTAPPMISPSAAAVERRCGRVVLAHGEVTGHAHAIRDRRATMFRDPAQTAMFLRVSGDGPVALEHEEHDTIHIPPGDYEVVRQREYTAEAIRAVAD